MPKQDAPPYDPSPKAGRGLHAIALIELIKSVLALLAASGLEILGPQPIRELIEHLVEMFQFDAQHSALASFAQKVSPQSVHVAAAVAGIYGVLHLIEAWGLWHTRAWASWLGCIAAAIYLPFELYALIREPGWIEISVVAINLTIVWVLARDVWKRRAQHGGLASSSNAER
jgi:uncharacterized membrane protein (DUF2068 family)